MTTMKARTTHIQVWDPGERLVFVLVWDYEGRYHHDVLPVLGIKSEIRLDEDGNERHTDTCLVCDYEGHITGTKSLSDVPGRAGMVVACPWFQEQDPKMLVATIEALQKQLGCAQKDA